MCGTMRAVTGALIVAIVVAWGAAASADGDDPFSPGDPFGPSAKAKPIPNKPAPSMIGDLSRGVPAEGATSAKRRIEHALDKPTKMEFRDAELGEVVSFLKREFQIEIQVDVESLEEYDLGSDTLVTCVLKDISLRSALRLMLQPHDLTCIIKDEVLLITTQEVAEEHRTTRVYEVSDLVTYRDEKGELWTDYEPLIHAIIYAIEPASWDEMGGAGSITGDDFATARVLVVKQTTEIHVEIAGLLTALRRIVAATPGDGQPPRRSRPVGKSKQTKPVPPTPVISGFTGGKM